MRYIPKFTSNISSIDSSSSEEKQFSFRMFFWRLGGNVEISFPCSRYAKCKQHNREISRRDGESWDSFSLVLGLVCEYAVNVCILGVAIAVANRESL